jgi:hypothetical protein
MTQPLRAASALAALGVASISAASILTAGVAASPAPHIDRLEPPTFNLAQRYARTLWTGEQSAVQACMYERGLDYTPAPFPDADDLDAGYAELRGRDLDALARDGYGVARSLMPAAPGAAVAHGGADDPTRFAEALVGPEPPEAVGTQPPPGWEPVALPGGGSTLWYSDACQARAKREIYGAAYPHDELELAIEELQRELRETLSRDTGYLWALSDWSACMRERGHTFDRPLAAARAVRDAHDGQALELAALERRERAIAADDARCDARVSLAARAEEALGRAGTLLRARHPELTGLERELELAVGRARAMIQERAQLSSGAEQGRAPRG